MRDGNGGCTNSVGAMTWINVCELKLDGHSLALIYEGGKLVRGISA